MKEMRTQSKIVAGWVVLLMVSVALPVPAQEKKTEKKAEEKAEKAKAEKVAGDIGLLDTEKNYMIVVTKDGKLVTIDYNQKTKVTELKEKPAKMADIGLGSAATVEYTKKGDKNFISKIEFKAAKGGE
jgi:major membrane immunogen (membrane-anchored lipoprotein)